MYYNWDTGPWFDFQYPLRVKLLSRPLRSRLGRFSPSERLRRFGKTRYSFAWYRRERRRFPCWRLNPILLGLYFSIHRGSCATRQVGVGSVLTFLGIACPVCNKILLFVFGWELLLIYFEPVRVYVALAGFPLTGLAVWLKWTKGGFPSLEGDTA